MKKYKKIIITVFILISLFGIVYSIYNLFKWKKDVNINKEIKEEINNSITVIEEKYIVDFTSLKNQNSDTVAYVKINNTNIDYVVVKGKDNAYYLRHNFKKEYNLGGWVFADYKNKFDGTDKNIVIYGHNMRDGSMLAGLQNFLNSNWNANEENLKITLVTENETATYQVFSVYKIEPEDYYINTEFKNDNEFHKFITTLRLRSIYDYKVPVNSNDSILTLSTCVDNDLKRLVVHAKKIIES